MPKRLVDWSLLVAMLISTTASVLICWQLWGRRIASIESQLHRLDDRTTGVEIDVDRLRRR